MLNSLVDGSSVLRRFELYREGDAMRMSRRLPSTYTSGDEDTSVTV